MWTFVYFFPQFNVSPVYVKPKDEGLLTPCARRGYLAENAKTVAAQPKRRNE